jgi:hypothetical protein
VTYVTFPCGSSHIARPLSDLNDLPISGRSVSASNLPSSLPFSYPCDKNKHKKGASEKAGHEK